jgi:hypothetical protein
MASQKISTMAAATVPLDGTELLEVVQGGVNKKVTSAQLVQTATYETTAPAAGVYADFALPGHGDYVYDVDTTAGDVEIDGVVAQRDGQRVTWSNTGANNLKLGVNLGTAANRIRANAGPLLMLQNDSYTIQYCEAILRWLVI